MIRSSFIKLLAFGLLALMPTLAAAQDPKPKLPSIRPPIQKPPPVQKQPEPKLPAVDHAARLPVAKTLPKDVVLTAHLEARLPRPRRVRIGSVRWVCRGETCTTTDLSGQALAVSACQALRKQVGVIDSFGNEQRRLSAAELQRCNGMHLDPKVVLDKPVARLPAARQPPPKPDNETMKSGQRVPLEGDLPVIISAYSPTRAAAGNEVTISGYGFGARSSGHSIKYGRGTAVQGDAAIVSWTDSPWAATSMSRVGIRLPGSMTAGTYWLALYEGGGQLAKGPETLQVSSETDTGAPRVTPAPIVYPGDIPVRINPELSIVSVDRTSSGPIVWGDRIPVEVVVRNNNPLADAEIAVGYHGRRFWTAAGYHSEPRVIRRSSQGTFRLELEIAPTYTRDGRFTTQVVLLDPRTFSFYGADDNTRDNSREISFEIGAPEFFDISVTWNRLEVNYDDDANASGEWDGELVVCVPTSHSLSWDHCAGLGDDKKYGEAKWPVGLTGPGGHLTMDVTNGGSYPLNASVTLTRVAATDIVRITTYAYEEDSWFDGGRHFLERYRIDLDPATWEGWYRAVTVRLGREHLAARATGLYYSGTLTITLTPRR